MCDLLNRVLRYGQAVWNFTSIFTNKSRTPNVACTVVLIAVCCARALGADTIAGIARNQTSGRLAAGDTVILLRLDQGMQEEARTKTDSQGSFTLNVSYPDKSHLLRVVHQGVNYDQPASVGDALSINVFDAAAKVRGLTGTIEIVRVGTNGNLLHVSDMVEIKNNSNPPLTQAGERTFEVYLPAHAKVDSVLAAGSGKIGVMISAAPVPGEPGHYTVNFSLRPGATKFAFNYDLPYDGHATFRTKRVYALQQLAIMIPETMRFTSRSPAFQSLAVGKNPYQVQAANYVPAGEGPGFEISGVGALPALQAQAQSRPKPPEAIPPASAPSVIANSGAPPHGVNASGAMSTSGFPFPWSRLQWWTLRASAVLLPGLCGLLLWRRHRRSANTVTATPQKTKHLGQTSTSLVQALNEELLQLEIDRSHGTISVEEYASAKQALEGTFQRALVRSRASGGVVQN